MPPPLLPDEVVEEVLLRLPPENPEGLVRAGLVCTRWRCLVSDPGFRRRFREFHRRPPMLGMLCKLDDTHDFVPTTAFCSPHADRGRWRAVDARHGRVLLHGKGRRTGLLVVWDPITNEVRELPILPHGSDYWIAAVLCSAAGTYDCDHLDCHHGPFLVVYVCSKYDQTFVYTYSSDAVAWSEPVRTQQTYVVESWMGSALVGNALYFGNLIRTTALKYNLELHQVSLIRLPSPLSYESVLTTTEDGRLGLVNNYAPQLYVWSRKDTHEVDAVWERRVIELDSVSC